MTASIVVDGYSLIAPDGWLAWKYDDSAFHRNQFNSFAGGSKAVDALILSDHGDLWLIEIKDYSRHTRKKPSSVFDEVALKVRSTLAALVVARVRAHDLDERTRADRCLAQATNRANLRVTLHLIQSKNPSRLFPHLVDPQDAEIQLRRSCRAVDPRAICSARQIDDPRLPWRTKRIASAR